MSAKADASANLAPVVKSVTVETELAPAPMFSPMQQVIDTVQKLTVGQGDAAPLQRPDPTAAPTTPTSSSRTMTLVLEPENLGTVTVKMQMRGTSLDLQLDVANVATLGLLTKDKDSLTAAMSGQDYQLGTLTMRASDTQTSSQGQDNGAQSQGQQSGSHMSSADGGGTSGGGSQSGNAGSDGFGAAREDRRARQDGSRDGQPDQSGPVPSVLSTGVYI